MYRAHRTSSLFSLAAIVCAIAILAAAFALLHDTQKAYADDPVTTVTIIDDTVIGPGQSAQGISVSADGATVAFSNVNISAPVGTSAKDLVRIDSSLANLVVELNGENSLSCDEQGVYGLCLRASCESSETIPQYSIVGPGSLAIDVVGDGINAANYAGEYFNLTVTDGASLDIECLLNTEPTSEISFAGCAINIFDGGLFVSDEAHIKAVSDAVGTIVIGSFSFDDVPLAWLRIESGAVVDLENRFAYKFPEGTDGSVETACLLYKGERVLIDNASLHMASPVKMSYTANGLMANYAVATIQNNAEVTYRTPPWESYHGQEVDISAMHGIIAPTLTIDNSTVDIDIDLSEEPDRIRSAYAAGIAYAAELNVLNGAQVRIRTVSDTACGIHWMGDTRKFSNGEIAIDASRVDIETACLADNLEEYGMQAAVFGHTLAVDVDSPDQGLFISGSPSGNDNPLFALVLLWSYSYEELPFDPEYKPTALNLGSNTGVTMPKGGLCSRHSVFANEGDEAGANDSQTSNGIWSVFDTVFDASDTSVPTANCAISYIETPAKNYTITVNAEGKGTATASEQSAAAGEAITLSAIPENGFHLKEWRSADVDIADNSFVMPDNDVVITAVFEANGTGEDDPVLPDTGDGNRMLPWLAALLLTSGILGMVALRGKRAGRSEE